MLRSQYEALKGFVKPGDIIYTAYDNPISKGIAAFQRLRLPSWESDYSHVGFIDYLGRIVESCISFKGLKMVSGIHVRPLSAWVKGKRARVVVQRFGLTMELVKAVSAVGYRLREKKDFYPIRELAGTAWFVAKYKLFDMLGLTAKRDALLDDDNLFNADNARVCIAFASHCFLKGANRPLVKNEELCTVGEGIQAGGEIFKF